MDWFILTIAPWLGMMENTSTVHNANKPDDLRFVFSGDRSRTWDPLISRFSPIVTSFGNPYVLHEMPHLPNLLLAYGDSDVSQRAAVKVWLSEIKARGDCPVKLPQDAIRPLPVL